MAIRGIVWTVDEGLGVTPTKVQHAGVQGDDKATSIGFKLPTELESGYIYRIEYVDPAGGYDVTDALPINGSKEVRYTIPKAWTQLGGTGTVRLVLEQDGMVAYSFEGRVKFGDRATAFTRIRNIIDSTIHAALERVENGLEQLRVKINEVDLFIYDKTGEINATLSIADTAIMKCNDAVLSTKQSVKAAIEAADQADDAADHAYRAATRADNAASAAEAAANDANGATFYAQNAANDAKTAAEKATKAADNANSAAVQFDLTNYVKNTDYAISGNTEVTSTPGIVRVYGHPNTGISIDKNTHTLRLDKTATTYYMKDRSSRFAILPEHIDYIVKQALTDNAHAPTTGAFAAVWTDEDKAAAQALLGGQMIKTIEPDENGNCIIRTALLERGVYSLPHNAVIYPDGVTSSYNPIIPNATTILIINDNTDVGIKEFTLIGKRNEIIIGFSTQTASVWKSLNPSHLLSKFAPDTIHAEYIFKGQPKMTAELAADDNSTNIPNTAWVNKAILNLTGAAGFVLLDFTTGNQKQIQCVGEYGGLTLFLAGSSEDFCEKIILYTEANVTVLDKGHETTATVTVGKEDGNNPIMTITCSEGMRGYVQGYGITPVTAAADAATGE